MGRLTAQIINEYHSGKTETDLIDCVLYYVYNWSRVNETSTKDVQPKLFMDL